MKNLIERERENIKESMLANEIMKFKSNLTPIFNKILGKY